MQMHESIIWETLLSEHPECTACSIERKRRCRLVEPQDARVLRETYLSAPYVHQNNQPKYHAMLLRAVEWAKRSQSKPLQILWVRAQDTPCNPKDIGRTPEKIDAKLEHFLQFHDQQTGDIPGLLPAFLGLRVRFTEKIKVSSKVIILKHSTAVIDGLEFTSCRRH